MRGKDKSVLVALSGGVDSSLTAALLKQGGWEVEAIHFLLPASTEKREKRLASVLRVVEHLKVPLSVADLQEEFTREIVEPFVEQYLKCVTPNPCAVCNRVIKFDTLVRTAGEKGLSHVATGHYARVVREGEAGAGLWRGKDRQKEQSYFLHGLNRSHLEKMVLPLGDMTKKETRRVAKEMALPAKEEPESQEICFIPENDYRLFLERREGSGISKQGDIVDRDGRRLGLHQGTYRYTIGQRHGLGIASPRPYYVTALRHEENQVVVGRKEEVFSAAVEAHQFNWVAGEPAEKALKVLAQIRYRHEAAPGMLEIRGSNRVRLVFDEPQWAITPGQALVCYDGDQLLGGGWIGSA